jgi:hypothetical protein
MNSNSIKISGPYIHENLTIFLVHGRDALADDPYVTLEEALDGQKVVVHETGDVGHLEIENLLDDRDVFIQAGDIVRGGRQDRTFATDYVVAAKSGRVPIPSFCVEHGRWHKRGIESERAFSSSTHSLSSKHLKLAAQLHHSQGAVWKEVAQSHGKLSKSLGTQVAAGESPSSYELALDHEQLRERRRAYKKALGGIVDCQPDVLGFVFAINGRLNSAEVYGSGTLFRKLWKKLLKSAAIEAIEEADEVKSDAPVTEADVRAFLDSVEAGPAAVQGVTDRITVLTRRSEQTVSFQTRDKKLGDATVHENCISQVA